MAFLFLLTQVSVAPCAYGQAGTESLTKEGIDLRRNGRDAEALAVFERILAIDGSPRTRAQVALAEQALGFWVEAERDLLRALSTGEDAWFVQNRTVLQRALDMIRVHLATLDVETNVAGAELFVNGLLAGQLPLRSPLRVIDGVVTLEAHASGFQTQVRTIHIAPQTHAREFMNLTSSSTQVSTREGTASPATSPQNQPPTPPAIGAAAVSHDEATTMRIGAWASLAGAAALLGGAGVALLIHNANVASFNDDARCFFGGLTRDQRCGSYRDAASTASTIGAIELGAAAAAAAAAIVLFSLAPGEHTARASAVRCDMGVGVRCGISF